MLRRVLPLSLVTVLFSLGLVAVSCGGSSNSGGGGGGPYNVVGNWQASFSADVGATTSGYGAIDSSGLGALFDTSGNIVQLPTITGTNAFSGNLTAYAVNGTFFSGGAVQVTDTAQGKVNSATSIGGTFSGTPSGTFSVVPFSPLSGSVVVLSGVMNGNVMGFTDKVNLTFSSNGTFAGQDYYDPQIPGCTVNGTLTQQGTSNVFDVTYVMGPGNCSSVTLTGIAFESNSDYLNVNGGANTTYLYVILLTSTSAQIRPYVVVIHQ